MPYRTDKLKLGSPYLDARVKLLDCQKERIPYVYEQVGSQRKVAELFGVSRRTIQFILDPSKRDRCRDQFKERRKDGRYYDKEKHRVAMDIHRKKKYELL